jgi:hypothetical protein
MLGIPKYEPRFYSKAKTFIRIHGDRLQGLVGKTICDYWLMWETNDNEWFSWGPIILKIDNQQFEFVGFDLDDFSLTIDQIDLNQKLDGREFGDEITLTWKSNCHAAIDQIIGLPIKKISLLTYKANTTVLDDKTNPYYIRTVNERGYMLIGIQFDFKYKTSTKYLQICNFLDQTVLYSKPLKENDHNKIINITGANTGYKSWRG